MLHLMKNSFIYLRRNIMKVGNKNIKINKNYKIKRQPINFRLTFYFSLFLSFKYLINIAIRYVKIIPKQSKKNISDVLSNDILIYINNLIIINKISNMKRININAFEGIKYISLFLISNLENLIKKKEKNIPTNNASNTSENCNRNIGNKNINESVLINKGGKIILLIDDGYSDYIIITTLI